MSVIVIDPGHGGTEVIGGSNPNNATGPRGTLEKNLTLLISSKVAELLNQLGYTVILTRTTDVNKGLVERARVAARNNAQVFVSVHFNDDENPSVQGTETWVHPTATHESKLLASSLLQKIVQVTGYRNRGVKSNEWKVLDPTIHNISTANCLIEISFISDPNDEARLLTEVYQNKLAGGISQAIIDYIKREPIQLINPVHTPFPTRVEDA